MKTPENILRYCANANYLLTKAGLPALFEPFLFPDDSSFGIGLTFRGVSVTTKVDGDRGTIVIRPLDVENPLYDTLIIDDLALALAQRIEVDPDCVANNAETNIEVVNATANITAIFAVATMLTATRFGDVRFGGE